MKLKRIMAMVLCVAMVLSTMGTVAFAEDVEQTVFEIASVEDFIAFAQKTQGGETFSGKTVILTADIDFDGANFLEIDEDGTIVTDYRIPKFGGTFDGDGHTIKNFNFEVKGGNEKHIMMFSQDTMWAYIKNLNIENVNVNIADISGETRVTALANRVNAGGMTDAAIKNVHVKNFKITSENTTSSDFRIGGLAYFTQGSQLVMQDCSITGFEVNVNKARFVAGVAAVVKSACDFINVDVKDSVFNINEFHSAGVAGGFAAQTQDSGTGTTFTDCDVTNIQMNLKNIPNDIGGFVASIGAASQFYNCTTEGSITVTDNTVDTANVAVGGFVGNLGWNGMYAPDVQHEFNNCVADVDITAVNANVGGFIGNSTVSGYPKRYMPTYFDGCEAKGDVVTTNGAAGGFVGIGDRGIFTDCSASGDAEGRIAGGFWGEIYPKAEAESTGGWSYQDKVVTHTDVNSKSIVLEELTVTGTATGTEYEAGLIGFMKDIYVNDNDTLGYATPILMTGNSTNEFNRNSYSNDTVAMVNGVEYNNLHDAMVACKAGETVLLIADVDLAGIEWEPVSFEGAFDGINHTISNLTINKPGVSNTGFITSLNGTFKNVTFTNPTVTGGENTGVVAGRAGGGAALAENITVNGTIKVETTHSGYARAGVIVGGWAYGNYKNITVDGGDKAVSYIKHTGGGDGRYVAGIVGHADDVDSYVNCTVKNITIRGGWLCGGIAGPGPSDGIATGCVVENLDMGADYSGGMFGWYYGAGTIEDSTIKNLAFTEGTSGNGIIGGYAPNDAATVSNVTFENVTNGNAALIDLVAKVNGISYLDLDSALAAAQSGDTVVLVRGINKAITLGAEANGVILDLNSLMHKTNIIIEEGITVEIKNGTIINNDSSKSAIETKGTTTITNVDIQSARHCVRVEGGLTTIKGGNYSIIGSAGMTQHAVNVSDGGEVVIYNGSFTGPMGTGSESGSAVCVQAGSKVTILDGIFTNGMLSTLDVKEGATLEISSGSFDQDPTDYISGNAKAVKNTETGLWSVQKKVISGGPSGATNYTLTFETNGGKTVNKITKAMNAVVDLSDYTTEKDGYIFAGWYADKDFSNEVASVKLTKNTTVYAKWTKESETDNPATEEKDLFVDVETDDWFYENVKYVVKNKLMHGVSEDQFAPNDTLTRAMLVTILYRLESEPETDNVSFTDVKSEEYYANAVSWAKQKGIVSGITETEFAPDSNITREQIATIIYRYADFKGYDVSVTENTNIFSYADAESISDYAVASIKYAVGSGLIQGKSATTLNPKDNATRAEIAAILQRFIEANKQ